MVADALQLETCKQSGTSAPKEGPLDHPMAPCGVRTGLGFRVAALLCLDL